MRIVVGWLVIATGFAGMAMVVKTTKVVVVYQKFRAGGCVILRGQDSKD